MLEPQVDIDKIFAETRILLTPSLCSEAFGLIVVEAMLRGIPVISSNAGGLAEAKLGVPHLVDVKTISEYTGRYTSRMVPIPVVPEQNFFDWEKALAECLELAAYRRLSAASRTAALEFVDKLSLAPLNNLCRS